MRRSVLALLLALAALTPACGPLARDHEQVATSERMVIRFSHVAAENTPKGLAARRFAQLVHERSGGRLEVQVYANSQLYGDGEEFQALLDGKVQFIAPSTAKLSDLVPEWQVFDLPFLFADEQEVIGAMTGPPGQRLLALLPGRGMIGLAMWDNGFKHMTSRGRPLHQPQDARGLTFRIQGSRVLREQFLALGATPVPVVFGHLYRALEAGQVDGQENTLSNIVSKRIHFVQSHLTLTHHGYLGYVVLTNRHWWEALPPADRALLSEALAETTHWVRENAPRLNREALEQIRAAGTVSIHMPTPAERAAWRHALEPVYGAVSPWVSLELVQAIRQAAERARPQPGPGP